MANGEGTRAEPGLPPRPAYGTLQDAGSSSTGHSQDSASKCGSECPFLAAAIAPEGCRREFVSGGFVTSCVV